MRNIFKKQNNKEEQGFNAEIFKDWSEMEKEQLRREIKKQKTEDLKELLKEVRDCMLIGLAAALIGLIVNELLNRD